MLENGEKRPESRRVRMTKRMIKDTLAELLQRETINSVTVKKLCAVAEINRSTFYAHYPDVFAVLDDIERDFLAKMPLFPNTACRAEESKAAQTQLLNRYVRYIQENRSAFIALCESGRLSDSVYDHVLKPGLDIFAPGVYDPELYRMMVCHINTGTNAVLIRWLKAGSFSVEEITTIILNLLPSPLNILSALMKSGYKLQGNRECTA